MEELGIFAIGAVVGAVLGPKLRSALLAVTTAGYRVTDTVTERTSGQWKAVETFFAEARDKARTPRPARATA